MPKVTQLESGRAKKESKQSDAGVHAVTHYGILRVGYRRAC